MLRWMSILQDHYSLVSIKVEHRKCGAFALSNISNFITTL